MIVFLEKAIFGTDEIRYEPQRQNLIKTTYCHENNTEWSDEGLNDDDGDEGLEKK